MLRHYAEPECLAPLRRAGISANDAKTLRLIALRLHRWHELECGVEEGGVERDEVTGKCAWYDSRTGRRTPHPDHETPALARLKALMSRYPTLGYYVQGDPRGAAVYVLRPGDVPDGADVDAYYSRGLAVYR